MVNMGFKHGKDFTDWITIQNKTVFIIHAKTLKMTILILPFKNAILLKLQTLFKILPIKMK